MTPPALLALLALAAAPPPAAAELKYWIEPCAPDEARCQPGDAELARWALEAWGNASAGKLVPRPTGGRAHARIQVLWATAERGLYGEARPIRVDGQPGAEVYILPAPLAPADPLARDAIVYLTCLHETGHALGLAHTAAFDDIMYSFQYGGDIPEYFARYRRKLAARADIRNHPGLSAADIRHVREALEP